MAETRATRQSAKTLRELPDAEIEEERHKLREQFWHCRLKTKDGSLQQTHQLSAIRHQIARIETILRERSERSERHPSPASPTQRGT